jgi:uncharacterized membrane protein YhiD involved in acid resistance
MLEALNAKGGHVELTWDLIALRLLLATFLGCVVALIRHFTRGPNDDDVQPNKGFAATLILLSLLLAMVVITVEGNLARAFSLAGIMAIVRFRTVVENTRDSVFVICSVVVGMATGAGFILVSAIGLPLIALAAWFTMHGTTEGPANPTQLKIRIGLANGAMEKVEETLRRITDTWKLVGTSTAKQGAAIDVAYQVRLKPSTQAVEMIKEFNKIEGVQEVEWKGAS